MSLVRKIVLYPFAIVFNFLTSIRNFFFDVGLLKEQTYDYLSIGVGNISLGGTGKSVLVSYLAGILNDKFTINILSRGYGRKSSGFQMANKNSSPKHLGDEPFMFYMQNQKTRVGVCNSRREGMLRLIESTNKNLNLKTTNLKRKFRIIGSAHNLKEIKIKELQKTEEIFLSPLFKKKNKSTIEYF